MKYYVRGGLEEQAEADAFINPTFKRRCSACKKALPQGTAIYAKDNFVFCGRPCRERGPHNYLTGGKDAS
jgi:hypothetical protein